jgi:L-iditol 2-dehydrogenase
VAGLGVGQSVLILGGGISGLLHLLLARAIGVEKVIVTDISEYRLNLARELGADTVIHGHQDVPTRLREANNGRGADLVIICTTAFSAFIQALKSVERAGTILCFAPTDPGVTLPVPVNEFWRNNIKIIHSYGNSPLDATLAIELIRKGKVPVGKMITHRLSLEEVGLGFRLVAESKESMKVIIEPHRARKVHK